MRANFLHLQPFLPDIHVQGCFAEFGLWYCTTFVPLAYAADCVGRKCVGVDTFAGMVSPTDRDAGQYGTGSLAGLSFEVAKHITSHLRNVQLYQGDVGDVVQRMNYVLYAFAHIDLDQYAPTNAAIMHVWPHLSRGGIMAVHDVWPDRDTLASGAVADAMNALHLPAPTYTPSRHAIFRKAAA